MGNQANCILYNNCNSFKSNMGNDGVSFGTAPSFNSSINSNFAAAIKSEAAPSGMDIAITPSREQTFEGFMQLDTIAGGKIPVLFGIPTAAAVYPNIVICWFGNVNLFNVWIFLTGSRYIEKRFTAATAGFVTDYQRMHFGVALDGKVTPDGVRARVFVDGNEITSFTSDLDLTIASDWTTYAGIPKLGVGHYNNVSTWSQQQTIDEIYTWNYLKTVFTDRVFTGFGAQLLLGG